MFIPCALARFCVRVLRMCEARVCVRMRGRSSSDGGGSSCVERVRKFEIKAVKCLLAQ